jgi:hypothetical protein
MNNSNVDSSGDQVEPDKQDNTKPDSNVVVKIRKRRVCKSKNNIAKDANIIIHPNNNMDNSESNSNESHCEAENGEVVHEEKVAKKRGRKPKGGKIITQKLPNIILHLRCSLNDIKNPKDDNLSSYNVDEINIHNIQNYNSSSQLKGSELHIAEQSTVSASGSGSVSGSASITSTGNLFKVYDPMLSSFPIESRNTNISSSVSSSVMKSNNLFDKSYDNYIIADNNELIHKKSTMFTGVYSPDVSLYDNGYDDCNNESDVKGGCRNEKEIWRKINQLKISFHKSDICNNIGGTQRSACFWCTCDFDSPSIYIPKTLTKDVYNVYGCFCSPECAAAFLMNENIDTSTKFERYHLLNSLYGKIYKYEKSIKIAPNPFYLLNKFYGNLTIQEYRKLFQSDQMIYVVNKPLTHILPELYEDNNDFLLNNKIIPTNAVNIKKNKPLKSNIINNAFGITVGAC